MGLYQLLIFMYAAIVCEQNGNVIGFLLNEYCHFFNYETPRRSTVVEPFGRYTATALEVN